jgi:hypothetical protein
MQEYLIFKIIGAAITASLLIWYNMTKNKTQDPNDATKTYAEPTELEDGNFAIPKPADEYMDGVQYDSISSNIKPKQNESIISSEPNSGSNGGGSV